MQIYLRQCRSFSLLIGHKQGLHREFLIFRVPCSLSLFSTPPLYFPFIFLSIFPYFLPFPLIFYLFLFFRHSTSLGGGQTPPPGSAPGSRPILQCTTGFMYWLFGYKTRYESMWWPQKHMRNQIRFVPFQACVSPSGLSLPAILFPCSMEVFASRKK